MQSFPNWPRQGAARRKWQALIKAATPHWPIWGAPAGPAGKRPSALLHPKVWHDVNPPHGADTQGYFQFKDANGDIANLKWAIRAIFLKGEEKPRLVNSGFWELVSGTGRCSGIAGVGTLTLTVVSTTDRLFTLEGEVSPFPQ